jgi:gas vesicle protein
MSWLSEAVHQISWSSAAGVLFGAVISATVSFVLQRSSFKEARQQKEKDRREVRKAQALSLVFKMVRISSDLHNLGKAVGECLERAKKENREGMLFQFVPPTIPLPDQVRFSPDEMAWVLSVDNNLFNEMGPLDELHTSTVAIFDLYNTKRDKLLERLGAQMEGTIGTTFLTPEQKKWIDPRAVELDQLVEVMIQRSQRDSKECWVAFDNLTAVVSKEFSMKLRFDKKPGVP